MPLFPISRIYLPRELCSPVALPVNRSSRKGECIFSWERGFLEGALATLALVSPVQTYARALRIGHSLSELSVCILYKVQASVTNSGLKCIRYAYAKPKVLPQKRVFTPSAATVFLLLWLSLFPCSACRLLPGSGSRCLRIWQCMHYNSIKSKSYAGDVPSHARSVDWLAGSELSFGWSSVERRNHEEIQDHFHKRMVLVIRTSWPVLTLARSYKYRNVVKMVPEKPRPCTNTLGKYLQRRIWKYSSAGRASLK